MAKKSFIALTGLVILAVVVWFAWLRPTSTALVPLPNPNGYDDFRKAGQSLVNTAPGFWDLDHEKLRAYVLPNAEALKLLRVGLTRECRVPIEYSMAPDAPRTRMTSAGREAFGVRVASAPLFGTPDRVGEQPQILPGLKAQPR